MNREAPISAAVEEAYRITPRHAFVSLYRMPGSRDWREAPSADPGEHLKAIYSDVPLILSGDDDHDVCSTVSQPSLVLRMLDMLRLEPGQRVFELGTGSGWSAALMGRIVGPRGRVYTAEIIPELARRAAEAIREIGIENVEVIEGDGGEGHAPGAPYDRAVFTAGAYDLPRPFYRQIKEGGLLLAVVKTGGGGDSLFLLRRVGDHFESVEAQECSFVQMAGKHGAGEPESICLETTPEWRELASRESGRMRYWWGGKGRATFLWRTWGIRSFLGVTEPWFRSFKAEKRAESAEEYYFGLWDRSAGSLVVAKDDFLISYGGSAARERFLHDVEEWVRRGMPTVASFRLCVYPLESSARPGRDEWMVERAESRFLWSLTSDAAHVK